MWAKDLGDDEYEIQNVLFYAYDLHLGDVVRATADAPDQKPLIRTVVRRSGHYTLRIMFLDEANPALRDQVLDKLAVMGGSWEGYGAIFAVDLPPTAASDAVRDYLETFPEDALGYETCEARVAGSFDTALEEA